MACLATFLTLLHLMLMLNIRNRGDGKPQFLKLGFDSSEYTREKTEGSAEQLTLKADRSSDTGLKNLLHEGETESDGGKDKKDDEDKNKSAKKASDNLTGVVLPPSKAALVEMKVKDKDTKEEKTKNFLYLPKTFQYTITNCFCGGNCQEIHDPKTWKCNDTCRRICKTSCTVCGTRQL